MKVTMKRPRERVKLSDMKLSELMARGAAGGTVGGLFDGVELELPDVVKRAIRKEARAAVLPLLVAFAVIMKGMR